MARRQANRLSEIFEAAARAVKAISDEPCPDCEGKTLVLGYVKGSHIAVECEGLGKKNEPCGFTRYARLSQYHSLAQIRAVFNEPEPTALDKANRARLRIVDP